MRIVRQIRLAALRRPHRYKIDHEDQTCVWSRVDVPMLDVLHPADDQLMTLKEACEKVFGGAVKPASLRAEHRRGNLVIIRVGRTDFVTRGSVKEMLKKCQLDPSERDRGFGSSQSARMEMEASRPHAGSYATAASSAAQDALSATLKGLRKH